jgi:hypothetical protein
VGLISNFYHALAKLRKLRYENTGNQTFDGSKPLMLTFLCPTARKPSGGTKVIYRYVSLLNQANDPMLTAQIFHAAQPSFRCQWHYSHLKFKSNYQFDGKNEIYFLHEMWASREAPVLVKNEINYGILVQGAYLINRKADYEQVKFAYENANVILCVSQDIFECLTFLFPHLSAKIIQLGVSVDSDLFKPNPNKENLITYMPRRLKKHAELVLFFLSAHLPSHWKIEAIDGMSESQVADKLSRSKIFMSFSELEGLGLPPIEAALSGNAVVGYTGEGGKEYWHSPIFTGVSNGDIRTFAHAVLDAVQRWDANHFDDEALKHHRSLLAAQYSKEHELTTLLTCAQQIKSLLT